MVEKSELSIILYKVIKIFQDFFENSILILAGRWGWFLSKVTCFGLWTKIEVLGKWKLAAVLGCLVKFDMYVYIHIASGIYLQTYVGYSVG